MIVKLIGVKMSKNDSKTNDHVTHHASHSTHYGRIALFVCRCIYFVVFRCNEAMYLHSIV